MPVLVTKVETKWNRERSRAWTLGERKRWGQRETHILQNKMHANVHMCTHRPVSDTYDWRFSVCACSCVWAGVEWCTSLKSHNSSLKQSAHPPPFLVFLSPPLLPPGFQCATPQNELITRLSKATDTIGTGITRGVNTHTHRIDNPDLKAYSISACERERKTERVIKRRHVEEWVHEIGVCLCMPGFWVLCVSSHPYTLLLLCQLNRAHC